MSWQPSRSLALVLGIGLAIRGPFVFWDPHVIADPQLLATWAGVLRSGGLPGLLDSPIAVLYPPLLSLTLWGIGILAAAAPTPDGQAHAALILVKLVAVAGDLVLAWLVARLLAARGAFVATAGAALIAFNPALWYASSIWGQVDSVLLVLSVGALAAVRAGRGGTAWATWSAGVLWKLQALAIAPIVAARTFVDGGWRKVATGATAAVAVAFASIATIGPVDRLAEYAARLLPAESALNVTAFNAWFLVGRLTGAGGLSDGPPGVAAWAIGVGTVLIVSLVVAGAIARSPGRAGVAIPGVVLVMVAFLALPGMRERYLMGAIPLLALAALGWENGRLDRGAVVAFVVLVVTQLLNLVAVGSPLPSLWSNVFAAASTGPLIPTVLQLGVGAAIANISVFVWAFGTVVASVRSPRGPA